MPTEARDHAELLARVEAARDQGDHESWAEAVLDLASSQMFGAEPGRLPAQLYDVLVRTTDDALRCRLAAALARCWVYASEAGRARPFAVEAVDLARRVGDAPLLADALDAALAAHWGPDDLDVRRDLSHELVEVAAHVHAVEPRLQAHLWGLQVACELLDVHAMHRQMRALELLAEESPRALFFASTRRAMLDLIRGRHDTVPALLERAEQAGEDAGLPDAFMVIGTIRAYAALQRGDYDTSTAMAAAAENFAVSEAVMVVYAESAFVWMASGELDRAEALIRTFRNGALLTVPADQDWLLTLQLVLEVALGLDDVETVVEAADLLLPYAGRAVMNAGAVLFHGVTDDPLSRALLRMGQPEMAAELRTQALATYERIGAQWWRDRLRATPAPQAAPPATARHLRPTAGGLWAVGASAAPVAGLRGFSYLRLLLREPGREHRALDLMGEGGSVIEQRGLGEVADLQALAAYRSRLAEIQEELEEAEDWADAGRLEAAREERAALLDELSRVAGLGGRTRVTGSSQERARVAVKKAITTAINKIETVDHQTADHLRRSVRTGLICSYDPDPGTVIDWVLDA